MKHVTLSDRQRYALEKLWFLYGNHGPKHTMRNHRFIQNILEKGKDYRDFYKPDAEAVKAVDAILNDDVAR